ncbi:MAG: end-binding protein Ku [Verrucomicrobiota bacterium]|nr:end-binding protein Ku [Verrucomicrobiota bacterium]
MARHANWKGFLRLSRVTCPVAIFPATSESEKVSFNQINKNMRTSVGAQTGIPSYRPMVAMT